MNLWLLNFSGDQNCLFLNLLRLLISWKKLGSPVSISCFNVLLRSPEKKFRSFEIRSFDPAPLLQTFASTHFQVRNETEAETEADMMRCIDARPQLNFIRYFEGSQPSQLLVKLNNGKGILPIELRRGCWKKERKKELICACLKFYDYN